MIIGIPSITQVPIALKEDLFDFTLYLHILVAVTKFISTVLTIPGGCVLPASVAVSTGGRGV